MEEGCQEEAQKKRGREEGKVDEVSGERRIRTQIAQKVVVGIKENARVNDCAKEAVRRPAGQSFMRSWDCAQIENEEEEESWRERDQMAAQWDDEQQLEEILERRWMEGSSLQLEVMQKVPEQVVHESMSQGKGVKDVKEKKKVPVWSTEEMREKLNIAVESKTLKK